MWDVVVKYTAAPIIRVVADAIKYFWSSSVATNEVRLNTARTLVGHHWEGWASEEDAYGEYVRRPPYDVTWRFSYVRGELLCNSKAIWDENGLRKRDEFNLKCRFIQDRILQIDYENEDANQVNFGTEILYLNSKGDKFIGKYVGWASDRDTIINGKIQGTRISENLSADLTGLEPKKSNKRR